MKKKIICAVMTGVIAATCAAPAFACTPPIKVDMSWKKDLNRTIANIKPQILRFRILRFRIAIFRISRLEVD